MANFVECTECGTLSDESTVGDTTVIDRTEEIEGLIEVQFTCPNCGKFAQSIRTTDT